jgi:hypothetical protein
MDYLGQADGRDIPIPLVSKNHRVRLHPLKAGGHSRGAAVGAFTVIDIQAPVNKNGAPDGRYAHRLFPNPGLINNLRNQTLHHPVAASRAVRSRRIVQRSGPPGDNRPPFPLHFNDLNGGFGAYGSAKTAPGAFLCPHPHRKIAEGIKAFREGKQVFRANVGAKQATLTFFPLHGNLYQSQYLPLFPVKTW